MGKKRKKTAKKKGFSSLLSISIMVVIAVLTVDVWLIFYHNYITDLPQTDLTLLQVKSKNKNEKTVKTIYNITGTIYKLSDDQFQLATDKTKEVLEVKLLPSTKYIQLQFITENKKTVLKQVELTREQLKLNSKVNIQTEENIKSAKELTAKRIEVLPQPLNHYYYKTLFPENNWGFFV